MRVEERQLESFIADSYLVSPEELEAARQTAREKNRDLAAVLLDSGALTPDDLSRLEAYALGVPFADLKGKKLDFETLSLIPEPVARHHNAVAFGRSGDALEVAFLDIRELPALDFVRKKGFKLLPRLTDSESMKWALLSYQKTLRSEFGDIIQEAAGIMNAEEGNLSAARIVDTLVKHAILEDASDVHIEPEEDHLLVRYRIDGILRDSMVLPKRAAPGITARLKRLAGLDPAEKGLPQDGRFKVDVEGEKISCRVSTLPTAHGEKVAMRLMRESAAGFTLESLGFHGENLEEIHHALNAGHGLVIVAGPEKSGKTTTLYTMLDLLNAPGVNVSTIEDPVECRMPRVNQCQVRPEIGLTFAEGLRALLRQAPDVVMVGDLCDGETAAMAVNAALSGRLVLVSLKASSTAQAVKTLMDMNVDPSLLAASLKLVIFQHLSKTPSAESRNRIIPEVIRITPPVRELIKNGAFPSK